MMDYAFFTRGGHVEEGDGLNVGGLDICLHCSGFIYSPLPQQSCPP